MKEFLVIFLLAFLLILGVGGVIYMFWAQHRETKEYIKWLIELEKLEEGERNG